MRCKLIVSASVVCQTILIRGMPQIYVVGSSKSIQTIFDHKFYDFHHQVVELFSLLHTHAFRAYSLYLFRSQTD
ncbi:Uncharacterised protein [Porphyromonas cangingivalis]|uniref:Uncharacterized protein n=1 Tax=Porphyromonas cangingivalis TaxID=36874 RepID=A0A1T4KDP8_PORCN|nr:hypothetical protein SAMN02745205_00682 [Porphyromonas cangingivalis]VEJ02765.1 Uncharacterised protein [Porphyromonas cangingivalis]